MPKTKNTMTRDEVKDMLIEHVVDQADSDACFAQVLQEGCRGYENFTNKELEAEYLDAFDEHVKIEEEEKK
jgi:hypothetical protein